VDVPKFDFVPGSPPNRTLHDRHNSASRVAPLYDIEPDSRNARVYEKRYATFRKLYPRIRDLMEELGADSESEMSRAD
jgi:hypothetical protein